MFNKKQSSTNNFQSFQGWDQQGQSFGSSNNGYNPGTFNQNGGFQSSIPQNNDLNNDVKKSSSVAFESPNYRKKSIWPYILAAIALLLICLGLKFFVFDKAADIPSVPDEVEFVIKPKAERIIPFTVVNELGKNCYFYLDSDNDEKDTGFLVNSGETVEVKVPIGEYDLYYASGDKWKNLSEKFGPETNYFKSNDIYVVDNEHVWTVTVFTTSNSDSNISLIGADDFPI